MARSSSRLAGDRPEIGEADGLQAVGTRPVEIGDALRPAGKVAVDIGEPALPVAAVGGELAALVITEAEEDGLIIARRLVSEEHAAALIVEGFAHGFGLDAPALGEEFFGVGLGSLAANRELGSNSTMSRAIAVWRRCSTAGASVRVLAPGFSDSWRSEIVLASASRL